ncbi:hypothetical protein CEXT_208261 [Caerostris extrusa]|uniref:Uncharacterized protein n=1 Tax=Caerostris extrusa TaxID=172846 RepID=A0AAV4MCP0_CAEEX|nr:hypothetical protein CEXT_208261 [Caerostris extrusa]
MIIYLISLVLKPPVHINFTLPPPCDKGPLNIFINFEKQIASFAANQSLVQRIALKMSPDSAEASEVPPSPSNQSCIIFCHPKSHYPSE